MKNNEAGGKRPTILAIGSNLASAGLTRVMHSIFRQLKSCYEIHYIGIAYKGPVVEDEGLKIYPSNLKGGDVWGGYQGKDAIASLKPDIVFLMNDLWMLPQYLQVFEPHRQDFKLVVYVPLDGKLVDDKGIYALRSADRFAVYSEFARQEVEQSMVRLQKQGSACRFSAVDAIALGVDTSSFYPLPGSVEAQFQGKGRLQAKQAIFPDEPDLWDSFVVLNANRPQPRKRIDLTLESFALFARNKPANVKLYLHHAIMNPAERAEIVALAKQFGILERLKLTPVTMERDSPLERLSPSERLRLSGMPQALRQCISDRQLNQIYNACEVGINTAMGEGWGLVSFEHAATGAAQIVPQHSACTESWTGAAVLLNPVKQYVPVFSPLEMAEINPKQAAEALEQFYCDRNHLQKLSKAACDRANQSQYRWQQIAQQWEQLLSEMSAP